MFIEVQPPDIHSIDWPQAEVRASTERRQGPTWDRIVCNTFFGLRGHCRIVTDGAVPLGDIIGLQHSGALRVGAGVPNTYAEEALMMGVHTGGWETLIGSRVPWPIPGNIVPADRQMVYVPAPDYVALSSPFDDRAAQTMASIFVRETAGSEGFQMWGIPLLSVEVAVEPGAQLKVGALFAHAVPESVRQVMEIMEAADKNLDLYVTLLVTDGAGVSQKRQFTIKQLAELRGNEEVVQLADGTYGLTVLLSTWSAENGYVVPGNFSEILCLFRGVCEAQGHEETLRAVDELGRALGRGGGEQGEEPFWPWTYEWWQGLSIDYQLAIGCVTPLLCGVIGWGLAWWLQRSETKRREELMQRNGESMPHGGWRYYLRQLLIDYIYRIIEFGTTEPIDLVEEHRRRYGISDDIHVPPPRSTGSDAQRQVYENERLIVVKKQVGYRPPESDPNHPV